MSAQWQQLIIQLGISGLIVFVGYRIAMRLIDRWTQTESERTKVWATAEDARTKTIQDGFKSDIDAHNEITKAITKQVSVLSRLEGKVDAAFDLTPVRGVREYAMREHESEENGTESERRTPQPPMAGEYMTKRPKTSG